MDKNEMSQFQNDLREVVGTSYTVKAGDTLYAIALRYGVTITQLVNANGIANPNLIRVGQVLIIP
mgnify:CR=1 FL=1